MITFGTFNTNDYKNCLIVTDKKLAELYGVEGENVFVLPQGEQAKSFLWLERLCSWFLSKRLSKDGKVVAVGGGSVGDVTGFAASVYKRGVNLLQVPTTLLAQIDSGIGGKTAIDLDGIKNAVGSFHRWDTLIDVRFLETLEESQLADGLGELFKYRMLSQKVDDVYKKNDMAQTIRACAHFKQQVVDGDFWDNGARKMLNAGHTVGHAMELRHGLGHGIAVANGLYHETEMCRKLGLCSRQFALGWKAELAQNFPIVAAGTELLPLMLQDKKNEAGKICFCFVCDDGVKTENLDEEQVKELLG